MDFFVLENWRTFFRSWCLVVQLNRRQWTRSWRWTVSDRPSWWRDLEQPYFPKFIFWFCSYQEWNENTWFFLYPLLYLPLSATIRNQELGQMILFSCRMTAFEIYCSSSLSTLSSALYLLFWMLARIIHTTIQRFHPRLLCWLFSNFFFLFLLVWKQACGCISQHWVSIAVWEEETWVLIFYFSNNYRQFMRTVRFVHTAEDLCTPFRWRTSSILCFWVDSCLFLPLVPFPPSLFAKIRLLVSFYPYKYTYLDESWRKCGRPRLIHTGVVMADWGVGAI